MLLEQPVEVRLDLLRKIRLQCADRLFQLFEADLRHQNLFLHICHDQLLKLNHLIDQFVRYCHLTFSTF